MPTSSSKWKEYGAISGLIAAFLLLHKYNSKYKTLHGRNIQIFGDIPGDGQKRRYSYKNEVPDRNFLKQMPKIELHAHLHGSIRYFCFLSIFFFFFVSLFLALPFRKN